MPDLELICSCYDDEKDRLAFSKVDCFLPNKVYYHGCLKAFLQITKWKGPEVVIFLAYIGTVDSLDRHFRILQLLLLVVSLFKFFNLYGLITNSMLICKVIYFGDHLFSDLRGPSKAGWRTAAIIHELEVQLIHLSLTQSFIFYLFLFFLFFLYIYSVDPLLVAFRMRYGYKMKIVIDLNR